jgi:RsiW-degrading membrane proteinase PrsW (M82 family)
LSLLLLALKFLARKRGVHMSVPRKLIIAVLLTVAYTTVVLWYLRQHWHNLILDHPRLLLGYVFLTGTLGVVAVQMLRQNHDDQVRLTLAVKWIFRAVGAALLYNSTASPLGSMSVMSLGILLYMTYVLYKPKHLIPHIAGTSRSQTEKATTQVDEQESTVTDKKSAPSARARKGKSRPSGARDRGTASPARADGRKSP